jgi:type IX secretion system PorP/SprF family membrane protein
MNLKHFCLLILIAFSMQFGFSQEGLPIYSDYLTDNYYLIHPSMAGASNCSKVRLTGRQQWFGHNDAPSLNTLSLNGRIGDSQSGVGAILYADKNGYHSQMGGYLTYAHHIMFSRNEIDLNMLSFGISVGAIQYKLDTSDFYSNVPIDQQIDDAIYIGELNKTELNLDFGFSYHYYNFYAHATVKNLLENSGINSNIQTVPNMRRYLVSIGNVFGNYNSDWSFEPSVMFQYKEATEESSIDVNAKVYKETDFGKVWGGLSYRRSLDGAEYIDGNSVSSQKLQYITPLIGLDYKNFMFAYTYSYQANSIVFNNGGYHQITLGFNFNCRREKYDCNCPAVN